MKISYVLLTLFYFNGCLGIGSDKEEDKKNSVQTWEITEEFGRVSYATVDPDGNFSGVGWSGEAPGCADYPIEIKNGNLYLRSMAFDMQASYCNGSGQISASCFGTMDKSYPEAESALGSCTGTIEDPLEQREFSFMWTAKRTSAVECGPDKIKIGPKITGSLTNITQKVSTTCPRPLNGIICFKGGNKNQCSQDITQTPSSNALPVAALNADFAVDFLMPDGVEEISFLYCDSSTLSLITPRTCSNGSEPQVKTVRTSPDSSGTRDLSTLNTTNTFAMTDGCSDNQSTNIRFYDFENDLVWPSTTTQWVLENEGQSANILLQCIPGSTLCYGANSENNDKYWGVALNGTGACSACCYPCDGGTFSARLTCN